MPEPDPYLHFRQTRCPFIDILPDAAAPAAAQAARVAIQRPAPHAAAAQDNAAAGAPPAAPNHARAEEPTAPAVIQRPAPHAAAVPPQLARADGLDLIDEMMGNPQ